MLLKCYRASIRLIDAITTIGSIWEASLVFPKLDSVVVVVTSGVAMKIESETVL